MARNEIHRFASSVYRYLTIEAKVPTYEWAAQKRMMPSGVTAKPGPYSVSITPWAKAAQDDFDNPDVQTTVLCWGSRLGKTESELNLIGRTIDIDPANIIVCYPTIDDVTEFFRDSFAPMVKHSACFRGKISSPTSKDGSNTRRTKRFPGGTLRGIGTNVPSAFRRVLGKVLIADEIDAYNATKEGDPIELFFKRSENFPDAIQVLSSTPTITGESRIWSWLERSDWQKWFVPSPYGEHWHVLDWENMRWDDGDISKAYYEDPVTKDPWTDEQRREMVMAGEWRATQEFTGTRGRHLSGMVSLFAPKRGYKTKFHQFVADYKTAQEGGPETKQVWTNTFKSEPWEDEVEQVDWEMVKERAEAYDADPVPDRVRLITFAADIQGDRIEFEWVGWGDDFESWGLHYGVIAGDIKRPHVWRDLEAEVKRKWSFPDDVKKGFARAFIDEGFRPDLVRPFCLKLMSQGLQVFPCKGLARSGTMEPELCRYRGAVKTQRGIKAPTYLIGTTRAKKVIYAHLLAECPGPNTMHFPEQEGYSDAYFQMLTSEKVTTKYASGQPFKVFEKPDGARNEALDVRVYNYAAAWSLNPNWDLLAMQGQEQPKKKERAHVEDDNEPLTVDPKRDTGRLANPRRRPTAGAGFVANY